MKNLLFSPIKIGSLTIPNRIIMPAITTNYSIESDERQANFYAEIARGGAGLIIMGAIQAIYPGRREDGKMTASKDEDIPHLKKLTKAVHDNGGKVAAMLAVWSLWSKDGVGTPAEDISPSGVVTLRQLPATWAQTQFVPTSRPLTIEEIHMIQGQVAAAASRVVEAGFDAVELQATAGTLIHRFINPHTNQRTDEYGGSMENRLRMLLETIALMKKKIDSDFPFILRYSGEDMVPWGENLEYFKQMAPVIERAGVHAFTIHPGWYETRLPRLQMSVPRGAFVYLAQGIKQVVKVPVAAANRINDPRLAEKILDEGKADLISMGRMLIADPDLPNKAKAGKFEDVRMCTACCNCIDDISAGNSVTCSVNARAGREAKTIITAAPKSKKVVVIGGGPGGMEAARVAALRGHKVTVYEKADKLGGQLLIAALPPYKDEWNTTIAYLTTQLKKLKVDVKLKTEFTLKTLEKEKPDAVIVATGALPIIPKIPGVDGKNVAVATDVLTGKKSVGQNVIMVGGGLVGCETAEFLYKKGKQVTVLEMLSKIANDVGPWSRWPLLDRMEQAQIKMEVNEKVQEITDNGVKTTRDGKEEFFPADSVVIAVGMRAEDALVKELEGKVVSLFKVGTCTKPGKIVDVVRDGFDAGFTV